MRGGVFARHASRERSRDRRPGNAGVSPANRTQDRHRLMRARRPRSQDAVPAQTAPWGKVRRNAPRTDSKPRKNAVSVGVKDISTPSLHPPCQEVMNSARGSPELARSRRGSTDAGPRPASRPPPGTGVHAGETPVLAAHRGAKPGARHLPRDETGGSGRSAAAEAPRWTAPPRPSDRWGRRVGRPRRAEAGTIRPSLPDALNPPRMRPARRRGDRPALDPGKPVP